MEKRRYRKIEMLLPEIEGMLAAGKSHKEIEAYFGLEGDRPVHNLLKRQRRKEKKLAAGIAPRPKGRPRKDGRHRGRLVMPDVDGSGKMQYNTGINF